MFATSGLDVQALLPIAMCCLQPSDFCGRPPQSSLQDPASLLSLPNLDRQQEASCRLLMNRRIQDVCQLVDIEPTSRQDHTDTKFHKFYIVWSMNMPA